MRSNPKLYVDIVDGKSGFLTDKVNSKFRGFFLQYREQIADPNAVIGPIIYEWLRRNYFKFNTHWKTTQVKELNDTEARIHGPKKDWDL
jgi:hypothetical protein